MLTVIVSKYLVLSRVLDLSLSRDLSRGDLDRDLVLILDLSRSLSLSRSRSFSLSLSFLSRSLSLSLSRSSSRGSRRRRSSLSRISRSRSFSRSISSSPCWKDTKARSVINKGSVRWKLRRTQQEISACNIMVFELSSHSGSLYNTWIKGFFLKSIWCVAHISLHAELYRKLILLKCLKLRFFMCIVRCPTRQKFSNFHILFLPEYHKQMRCCTHW